MKLFDRKVHASISALLPIRSGAPIAVQPDNDGANRRPSRDVRAGTGWRAGSRFAGLLMGLVAMGAQLGMSIPPAQNFGTVSVNSSSSATAMTVRFASSGTLGSIVVSTQGIPNLDFTVSGGGTCTVSTAYTSGNTCSVMVVFTPTAPGLRLGAVKLRDGSGNSLGTGYMYGTGRGSLLRYNPGTQAVLNSSLKSPQAMVVDAGSNIYMADTLNARVIKLPWNGSSYDAPLLVGSGWSAPSGVAVDGAGNVYITDMTLNEIVEVPWTGSAYGTQFNLSGTYTNAQDLTIDGSGNLYILTNAPTITKLPWNGTGYGTATTIGSGLGGGQYNTDFVDSSGNIYVADCNTGNIVKETLSAGSYSQSILATFAPNGTPDCVDGVATDPAGDVYIADYTAGSVLMLQWNGSTYSDPITLTSNGNLSGPEAIYLDGIGNIYIEDFNNNLIEKWSVTDLPTLSFPTHTNVGSPDTTDNPQMVSLLNVGNAPLTMAVPNSGLNPTLGNGFSYSGSSSCPQLSGDSEPYQLASAASCTYKVAFTPVQEGDNIGLLVLTDDYMGAASTTQSIGLSGTGNIYVTKLAFGTAPASPIALGGNAGSAVTVYEEKSSSALDTDAFDLITLTVTGPSSYSHTYTATANAGVATFNLSSAALSTSGSYTYTASRTAVTSAIATETVNSTIPQVISFSPPPVTYGVAPFTLSATGGASGNPITFSLVSGPGTLSGTNNSTLTVTGAGSIVITASQAGNGSYSAGQLTATLVVAKTPVTVGVTSSLNPSVYGQSVSFTATANGGSIAPTGSVQFEVDGVNFGSAVALGAATGASKSATSQTTITLSASGSPHAVLANYLNTDGNFSNQTGTLGDGQAVTQAAQAALAVTGVPGVAQAYGSTFAVGTSGGSGTGATTYTAAGSCAISGTTVTIISGSGICSVIATKAADSNYSSATSTAATVNATLANQATLVVTGVPEAAKAYGATFTVGSSGGSGSGAVTFTASGSCSISGATVTITSGTGACTITAAKAADGNYTSATSAAAAVNTALASEAVLIVTGMPESAQVYGATFTVGSNGGSGTGAITYTATGSCSVSGTTVTITSGSGTCAVTANKAADGNYASATSATRTVGATLATQAALTVTGMPTPAQPYGSTFTIGSSGGNGTGAVTYTATGSCSISATTVTMTSGTGVCSVIATKAADSNYASATSTPATVTATKTAAAVTVWPAASSITYGQTLATSNLTGGTSSVNGIFAFTTPATAPSAGTALQSVTFTPADSANYTTRIGTASVLVNKATPTVSLWPSASSITYGQTLAASILSGGTASVSGTFTWTAPASTFAVGTAAESVTFTPTDASDYNTVPGSTTVLEGKAAATVTLSNLTETYSGNTLAATATTSPANLSVTLAYTKNGLPEISPRSAGSYGVTATVTDSNYSGTATGTLIVNQAPQIITFTPPVSPVINGVSPIALLATGGASGNPLIFSVVSGPGSVGGINNSTLTINGPGTVVVAANQAGNTNYSAAAQVTRSIVAQSVNLNINVAGLVFSSVPVGSTSAAQTLILTNPNSQAVTISGIATTGDFSAVNDCPTIAPFATCSVNVTFTPTAAGARSGTLTVSEAYSNSPQSIPLTGTGSKAGIQVTPSLLSFGSQVVATSSNGGTVTIMNIGTADLVVSSIAASGDFSSSGNCARIPAGSNCSLSVTFTPTTTGARSGALTLTDNAENGGQTQVVNLSGVGSQAGATLAPSVQTFPGIVIGASSSELNATLTNTGTAPLTGIGASILGDFTQRSTCAATLAPAATCTISVVYSPTVAGVESGSLIVTDNLGTQTAALVGTGLAPGASLNTAQLVFGGQLVGTSSLAQTVIFTNTGTAAVSIASVVPTSNFTDTTNCSGSIAAGASCSVNVLFAPTVTGPLSGTLTISDGVGNQVVTLQGQSVSEGLAVSPSFAIFGDQEAGTTGQAKTLVVTNTGTIPLTLNPIAVSNNFNASSQCPAVLPAAQACAISVSFSPTAIGTLAGSLVVNDATGQVSTLATLSGRGTLPGLATAPSTLSFGSLPVGTASQGQTVTVTNSGSAPLLIGTVRGTGDFAETDTCALQIIAPGGNCVISVVMTPTTIGTRTGTIQFNDNVDGTHQIALSGVGQQTGVSVFPTSLAFGSLAFVTTAQAASATGTPLSVTISNTGNTPLQLGGFRTEGDFSESDRCGATIAVGESCTLSVRFLPTALGHRTGTLTITDNAGGGTQSVSLQGDGSPAGLTLSPPVLNFGVQTKNSTSAAQTATLTNGTGQSIGNVAIVASGEFSESDNCGATLANGTSCTLNITVTPQTTGAITGTINISSAGSAPPNSQATRVRPKGMSSNATSNAGSNLGVVAVQASTLGNGNAAATQLAFDTAPALTLTAGGNAGSSVTVQEDDINWNAVNAADAITLTVSGPGGYSKSYTATASGGIASFNLSSDALTTGGTYAYTASVQSNPSIKSAAASETVNTGAAVKVSAIAGSAQTVVIGTAFPTPLQVLVTDAYNNPVSGAAVTFTGPASGAGVNLSSALGTTSSTGAASVTATANASAGSYTLTAAVAGATSASFSLTNAKATPTIVWAAPAPISQGTALDSSQLNATAGGIDGKFVYTPAAGTVLSAGQQTLSVTFTPTDTANYSIVSGSAAIVVNQVESTVDLAASSNESMLKSAITFTATVSRLTGTATGIVNFLDGATILGQRTLSGGVCTFSTTSLSAGSHAITAVYSGDVNATASASAPLSQLVIDFAVNAGNGASGVAQTVAPGGSATYAIAVPPTTGTTLSTAAILTVTGLPTGATAAITPSSWTQLTGFSWQLPANTVLTDVSLTIGVPLQTASVRGSEGTDASSRKLPSLLWGLLLLPLAGKLRRAGRRMSRMICLLLLLATSAAAMAGVTGCGGSNGFFAQPQKAYTVVVTVTAGSLSHSTNVTLTVQ